jgi:hypothetical protein
VTVDPVLVVITGGALTGSLSAMVIVASSFAGSMATPLSAVLSATKTVSAPSTSTSSIISTGRVAVVEPAGIWTKPLSIW